MTILHILIKKSVIFETHINRSFRCSYGYNSCVTHTDLITWVSKNVWEMLLSEFSQSGKISARHKTKNCNNFEQNIMLGELLNDGDNVDDKEDFGFTGSYFKIAPAVIDDYTKKKILNMQLERFRPMINIDNNDKQTDERYQKKFIDDK